MSEERMHQQTEVSASEINIEITRCYAAIQDIFKEFEYQEAMPTTEMLREVYNARTKKEEPKEEVKVEKTFWDIYDEFTNETGKIND